MEIKIKRLSINNFKPFKEYAVAFSSKNLIVFDGPNGFGKTSFYDAIELLFTGELRRYAELVDAVADGRQTISDGSPLLHFQSDGDLIIKAELEIEGKPLFLMRKEIRENLSEAQSISAINIPLYKMKTFDDGNPELVAPEEEEIYLETFFGNNHKQNFEFLNYIEQEESIYLLKQKDEKRKDAISHLFNTAEFEDRISTLQSTRTKILRLCDKKAKDILKKNKEEIDKYQEGFKTELKAEPYARLITWKELPWDGEEVAVPFEQLLEWLGEEGLIKQVELFVRNHEDFIKEQENKKIDGLLKDEKGLINYLRFWNFLNQEPEYSKALKLKKSINSFTQSFDKGVLQKIEEEEFAIPIEIQNLLLDSNIEFSKYNQNLEDISAKKKRSSSLSLLLNEIKDARSLLINKFLLHTSHSSSEGDCPLCGYSWENLEELKNNFDNQEKQLASLISGAGGELNEAVDIFEKNILSPIKIFLESYISEHPLDEKFVLDLQNANKKAQDLESINKKLTALNIVHTLYTEKASPDDDELGFKSFREHILSKKIGVNQENLHPFFNTISLTIFEDNVDHIKNISIAAIAEKRRYLEWQLSIQQSKTILKLQQTYQAQNNRLISAENQAKKIKQLIDIYKTSLVEYQISFIEKIEILFHIYSGRIAQETKGSLGLFIKSDTKGIRFIENHRKDTDAIFTMSSGQLSMLIIAFTLALNSRFSKNNLLFIDDPVQTLDELNIAGFIELLRNEFSTHQILISTHEDVMSAYMRYKFKKFNLGVQRLNFKETQLSN